MSFDTSKTDIPLFAGPGKAFLSKTFKASEAKVFPTQKVGEKSGHSGFFADFMQEDHDLFSERPAFRPVTRREVLF